MPCVPQGGPRQSRGGWAVWSSGERSKEQIARGGLAQEETKATGVCSGVATGKLSCGRFLVIKAVSAGKRGR